MNDGGLKDLSLIWQLSVDFGINRVVLAMHVVRDFSGGFMQY